MKTFGNILHELRKSKKMTQKELADELGISEIAVRFYEADRRRPNFEIMTKLEQFFQVTSAYLMGETDKNNYDCYAGTAKLKIKELKEQMDILENRLDNISDKDKSYAYECLSFFIQMISNCPLQEQTYSKYLEQVSRLAAYLVAAGKYWAWTSNPNADKEDPIMSQHNKFTYYDCINSTLRDIENTYIQYYMEKEVSSADPNETQQ